MSEPYITLMDPFETPRFFRLWKPALKGTIRVQNLGPPNKQFKIVKLWPEGTRVIVDQATKVEPPFVIHASYPMTLNYQPSLLMSVI